MPLYNKKRAAANKKKGTPKVQKTLDAKHQEMLEKFAALQDQIPVLQSKIEKKCKRLTTLRNKPKKDLSDAELDQLFILEGEIKDIEQELDDIVNRREENEYFLATGELLHEYHQSFETACAAEHRDRSEMFEEYMERTDEDYHRPDKYVQSTSNICSICELEKTVIHSEGISVCTKCGDVYEIIQDSNKPSYKDPPPEVNFFPYQRINHFREWLAKIQAKESTVIPQEVYDRIHEEIRKERITNMKKITKKKIRAYLKKLDLTNYYDHDEFIRTKITGLKPVTLSKKMTDILIDMFRAIQEPFEKVRYTVDPTRRNFPSYPYILTKFVELLERPDLKSCFKILKNRDKLYNQDNMWRAICGELDWPYIPTI